MTKKTDFEKVKLEDLKPAEYNPRRMSGDDRQALSRSMDEFGQVDPLIINLKNMEIIGGNQRYAELLSKKIKDAYLLRLGEVGWVFTDIDLKIKSDDHAKALNVALNKIGGQFDDHKLTDILSLLKDQGFDVSVTGVEDIESILDAELTLDELLEEYTVEKKTRPFFTVMYIDYNDRNKILPLIEKARALGAHVEVTHET